MKKYFIILLFCLSTQGFADTFFKERFTQARPGDFIVTKQSDLYCVLLVKSLSKQDVVLEEICVPVSLYQEKALPWRDWIQKKAPGHTAWNLYQIDIKENELIDSYSILQKRWNLHEQSHNFFAKLLSLPFHEAPKESLRRIGPAPSSDEIDKRALWTPPLTINGRSTPHQAFDVVETTWPKDLTDLSESKVQMYFNKNDPTFPFPYWMEIHTGHVALRLLIADSGRDLISPAGEIPKRIPRILAHKMQENDLILPILSPLYYKNWKLFAVDLQTKDRISLEPKSEKTKAIEKQHLLIAKKELENKLEKNHTYKWILVSVEFPEISIESDEVFSWPVKANKSNNP